MSDLVLVVDVGNSGAKLGAVRGEKVAGPVALPQADGRSVRQFATPLLKGAVATVAISGSNPTGLERLAWELRKLRMGEVVEVGADHPGIPAPRVTRPEQAGVDRRVQVLAAAHLAGGSRAGVISCGTALTVDVADSDGALLGGAILPGLGLGARALAQGTALLPEVPLAGGTEMPAKDTETAIRAGLRIGAAGAAERLLLAAGIEEADPVYLTGRDAPHLTPHLERPVHAHPALGILGVALAIRHAG